MGHNILPRNIGSIVKRIIVSAIEAIVVIVIIKALPFDVINNYFDWIRKAIITFFLCIGVELLGGGVFFKKDLIKTIQKIHRVLK